MSDRKIAIVGGGAAGIFAALGVAEAGGAVVLYERNNEIGIKIKISGGGKCNITHQVSPSEMEEGFVSREARFLRYAFNELTASEVLRRLHREGVETYTRENGRVFPKSGRSKDVLDAFKRMLYKAGVEVRTQTLVQGIDVVDSAVQGIIVNDKKIAHSKVIVTTGGASYKKVGTTGDGMRWAAELGLNLVPVRAALAPIYFPVTPPKDWQGVALRDIVLHVAFTPGKSWPKREGYPIAWRDDLLLTHRGISGPTTLEVSRAAALARETGNGTKVELAVDLLPDNDENDLRGMWQERLGTAPKSEVQSLVANILPAKLVLWFLKSIKVEPGTKVANVSREERTRLLTALKRWTIGEVGEVPIDRGEVTAGGVALNQVSRTTMESKTVQGLYVAGEALDVSGCVGGYNLQAAFSTGYVAGRDAGGRQRDEMKFSEMQLYYAL